MSRENKSVVCPGCESVFKLIYEEDRVNGQPKFCPWCADELFNDDDEKYEDDD